jgi:hypothetical protein
MAIGVISYSRPASARRSLGNGGSVSVINGSQCINVMAKAEKALESQLAPISLAIKLSKENRKAAAASASVMLANGVCGSV